jgi:hypothetical protein
MQCADLGLTAVFIFVFTKNNHELHGGYISTAMKTFRVSHNTSVLTATPKLSAYAVKRSDRLVHCRSSSGAQGNSHNYSLYLSDPQEPTTVLYR